MSFQQDDKRSASSGDAEKGIDIRMFQPCPCQDIVCLLKSLLLDDVEAIALPEFDDPNIDKDAAIAGILGEYR